MLILISGITGTVGHACARTALKAGHQVRGLGRTPDKLNSEVSEQLESFVKCENAYDLAALDRAVRGVDAIISAVAPVPEAILEGQLLLLRAAERAGVKIFHSASWNYDWRQIRLGEIEIYDAIICFWNHARLSSSIKPIHAFTGVMLEYMFYSGPGANPINKAEKSMVYFGTGEEMVIYTSVQNMADYTLQAISEPNAAEGGVYKVESFRCTHRQLAAMYGEVRGVELEMKCFGSVEDVEAMATNARATIPPTRFMEYNGLAFGSHLLKGIFNFEAVDSQRWSHIKQESFKDWMARNPDI